MKWRCQAYRGMDTYMYPVEVDADTREEAERKAVALIPFGDMMSCELIEGVSPAALDREALIIQMREAYARTDPTGATAWLAALAVAEQAIRADERAKCARVADRYAEQNRKASAENSRRANKLGNDPFGHGDMASAASAELDACRREAEAIAAAIRETPKPDGK